MAESLRESVALRFNPGAGGPSAWAAATGGSWLVEELPHHEFQSPVTGPLPVRTVRLAAGWLAAA